MARIANRLKTIRYLLKRDGPVCHYCGARLTAETGPRGELPENQITLDHIVPRSRGGTDHLENFVLSCPGCNQWKGREQYETHCVRCRNRFAKVAEDQAKERERKAANPNPRPKRRRLVSLRSIRKLMR